MRYAPAPPVPPVPPFLQESYQAPIVPDAQPDTVGVTEPVIAPREIQAKTPHAPPPHAPPPQNGYPVPVQPFPHTAHAQVMVVPENVTVHFTKKIITPPPAPPTPPFHPVPADQLFPPPPPHPLQPCGTYLNSEK